MVQISQSVAYRLAAVACLACVCGFGQAQDMRHSQDQASQSQTQLAKPSPAIAPAPIPPPAKAPSLLDHPAEPAKVTLAAGKLSILANNSSLAAILDQISVVGGMKVEGLRTAGNSDQRVFGSYGPGTPRDVLSDLLSGSGYNVLMLGVTPAGLPRELALTARPTGGTPNASPQSGMRGSDDDEGFQPAQYPEEQDTQPPPPPIPPGTANRVRSPQELLQELQRMHQEQQDQQNSEPSEGYTQSDTQDHTQPNTPRN